MVSDWVGEGVRYVQYCLWGAGVKRGTGYSEDVCVGVPV